MHAAEAGHGDLGMITRDDVVLALSNSGESDELLTIIPLIKRRGAKLIALTGNPDSSLAREADAHLDAQVAQEACPLNLAPTASNHCCARAWGRAGDRLAGRSWFQRAGTSRERTPRRARSAENSLRTYPRSCVRGKDIPAVLATASFSDMLMEISRKGMGMTAILGGDRKVVGIFTDGDLRRTLETNPDVRSVRDHRGHETQSADDRPAQARSGGGRVDGDATRSISCS